MTYRTSRLAHAGQDDDGNWQWRCGIDRLALCQSPCKAAKSCPPITANVNGRDPYYDNYAAGFKVNVR